MAIHAIYALASLCKNKFIDAVLADFAFETVGVICIVAGHDSFVENRLFTDIAGIGAISADWRTIREEEKISVSGNFVVTFSAFEAVDMEEALAMIERS